MLREHYELEVEFSSVVTTQEEEESGSYGSMITIYCNNLYAIVFTEMIGQSNKIVHIYIKLVRVLLRAANYFYEKYRLLELKHRLL